MLSHPHSRTSAGLDQVHFLTQVPVGCLTRSGTGHRQNDLGHWPRGLERVRVGFPLGMKLTSPQGVKLFAAGGISPQPAGQPLRSTGHPSQPAGLPLGLTNLMPCPQEYADNLVNSGVHGAVLVLEPTFNAEAMATALGIPSGKHILRRHLAEEMSAVFHPARWVCATETGGPGFPSRPLTYGVPLVPCNKAAGLSSRSGN